MTSHLEPVITAATWLLRASLEASVLVVLVLAAQRVFQQHLPARWRYALWMLVLIRMVMPVSLPSTWSISNALTFIGSKSPALAATPVPAAPMPVSAAKPNTPGWTVSYGSAPDYTNTGVAAASPASISRPAQNRPGTWIGALPPWTLHAAAALWLAVASGLLLRLIVTSFLASRRLRNAAPCDDARILALLAQCKAQAGVRANVTLSETSAVDTPALAGVFRPRLLMPQGLARSLSDKELKFVFLHELAHLRRRDVALNWLTSVLETLHWFNPLIWLAGARMRTDRELACDAMVLTWTGQLQRCDYGQTLLKLMESIPTPTTTAGAVGIVENNKQFARRITMISRFETSPKWSVLGLILVAVLALVGLTSAADKGDKPAEKSAAVTKTVNKIDAVAPSSQPAKLPPLSDEEIRKVLQRNVNLDFTNIPFPDAVDFLRQLSGVNIVVNRQAFHEAGLDEKALKVNVKLKNVTLDKALDVLLDEVGAQNKLGYKVDEGLIVVSTAEEMGKPRIPFVLNDENLAKSLARNVNSVEFADISLKDAISFIHETSGENIHVKWDQLENLGVSKGQPLNLRISGITFKRLLRLVMENACPAGVGILADRNVITISSAEDVAPMILCELKLISMPREDLAKLWLTLEPTSRATDGNNRMVMLDANQTEKLLAAVTANKNAEILSAPKVTSFAGQKATISIGSESMFATDYKKTVDASGVATYSPVNTTFFKGITIHMQGNVSKDRKAIDLNVKTMLTGFKEPVEEVPYPDAPANKKLVIKKVQAENATLETTVNIPSDTTAAIGGLKLPPWLGKGEDTEFLILVNASQK